MAEIANKILYRDEWIAGFERGSTFFRSSVTTTTMTEGKQAYFLVAKSNREAVTRGPNGLIPASTSDYQTPVVTLKEEHDKERGTRFKYWTGHADQRAIAQASSRKVIMRAIDKTITDVLATATITIGTAGTSIFDKGLVSQCLVELANNDVPMDNNIFCAITANQFQHLMDIETFASADYVDQKPFVNGMPNTQAESTMFRQWMGINWFVPNTALPGAGSSSAFCYMYHRDAVGYAYDSGDVQAVVGYNEEDDYYFTRHSIFHGALKLQNEGILKIGVKDNGYVAA